MKKTALLNSQISEVISKMGHKDTKETFEISPSLFNEIKKAVGDVKITFITHEELKYELKQCKAVVRTGEQTPYANVILKSGVVF